MAIASVSGHITADAITKTVDVGGVPTPVATFSVAENITTARGNQKTKYYRISLWRNRCKLAGSLLKGRAVNVQGELDGRAYINNGGQAAFQFEMSNPRIMFLDAKPKGEEDPDMPDEEDVVFEAVEGE